MQRWAGNCTSKCWKASARTTAWKDVTCARREIFWIRLTLSLVRDAEGQPGLPGGQIEDIDEQKNKSAALAESEARFRTMFETRDWGLASWGWTGRSPMSIRPFAKYLDTSVKNGGQTNCLCCILTTTKAAQACRSIGRKFNQFSDERRYIRKMARLFGHVLP